MMTFLYTELKNRIVKEISEFYIEIYYFPSVHLQILMINQNQFLEKGNQSNHGPANNSKPYVENVDESISDSDNESIVLHTLEKITSRS